MKRNFYTPGKTPHEQAQTLLSEVKIESVQHTGKATYYGFHTEKGNFSIIIIWDDGRAQLYDCRCSWYDLRSDSKKILFHRICDYIGHCNDKDIKEKLQDLVLAKTLHNKPLLDEMNSVITLELFIRIWGRKGYFRNFMRKSQHEVALEDLKGKETVKFIGSENTQYYALHENGNLSIVMLYADGTATRYDCIGTWDDIINKSEWFWKRTMDYIAKTNIDMTLKKKLGELVLNHILHDCPITSGMDKDNFITLELFIKIWGCKGRFTEYNPLL